MATNTVDVSAARPDVPMFGSLYMANLFAALADGSPRYLAPTWAFSRIPFGTTKAVRAMPDWIQGTRNKQLADGIRKINQASVGDLDAASLQALTLSPEERGLWAPVDYRQPQIVHGLGVPMARNLATKQTLGYLLDTMELVGFGGGTTSAPLGVNVATALGSGTEREVVNGSSLPFNSTGTIDLHDPDSDFSTLLNQACQAYETAHNVVPNTCWMASKVKWGLLSNNSWLSLTDRAFTFEDLQREFARRGITTIHVGRDNYGLVEDVMVLSRVEGTPGGESAEGYNPVVVGATDAIDAIGDYAMGASDVPNAPALAPLIGYREAKPEAGSIEKIRAACNFDVDVNYRGIVRIVNLFNAR